MRTGRVGRKPAGDPGGAATRSGVSERLTPEERTAWKELAQERRTVWGKDRVGDERVVLAKIAGLSEPDRSLGLRLHQIITSAARGLSPRLWYGMPAYAREGDVICFFQPASRFNVRYLTLGFSDKARLDDGPVWPTAFALKELTPIVEAKVSDLVRRAVR